MKCGFETDKQLLQLAVLETIKQRKKLHFTLRNKQELIKVSVSQHYLIVIISWLFSSQPTGKPQELTVLALVYQAPLQWWTVCTHFTRPGN